jgi:hypothetical protein
MIRIVKFFHPFGRSSVAVNCSAGLTRTLPPQACLAQPPVAGGVM